MRHFIWADRETEWEGEASILDGIVLSKVQEVGIYSANIQRGNSFESCALLLSSIHEPSSRPSYESRPNVHLGSSYTQFSLFCSLIWICKLTRKRQGLRGYQTDIMYLSAFLQLVNSIFDFPFPEDQLSRELWINLPPFSSGESSSESSLNWIK